MKPGMAPHDHFRCAGKVFIVGEYACIEGGPALVTTVAPEFSLRVFRDDSKESCPSPFAAQSPAGLYLAKKQDVTKNTRFEWLDPYVTPIGVGSSSAQFLLTVAAIAKLEGKPLPSSEQVLRLYWDIVGDTQGLRPSGVDVLAQWMGGPVLVCNEPFSARRLRAWNPNKAGFVLAFTGKKAKTHDHLKELRERGFPQSFRNIMQRLSVVTAEAANFWEASDERNLGLALNRYQEILTDGALSPADFARQVAEAQKWAGVLGCKGTGAQGGDCILFLAEASAYNDVAKRIQSHGWQPIVPEWANSGIRDS